MARAKGTKDKTTSTQTSASEQQSTDIPLEERNQMIAEAAYFRALARGFQGGDPVDDWLAAEAEVNRLLPTLRQQ
jgi:hypothetical protein